MVGSETVLKSTLSKMLSITDLQRDWMVIITEVFGSLFKEGDKNFISLVLRGRTFQLYMLENDIQ